MFTAYSSFGQDCPADFQSCSVDDYEPFALNPFARTIAVGQGGYRVILTLSTASFVTSGPLIPSTANLAVTLSPLSGQVVSSTTNPEPSTLLLCSGSVLALLLRYRRNR